MRRPETYYATCGDLSIAYQTFGDGPFDLLCAPGWVSHIEYAWESPDYARFLSRLAQFARVIIFDKRGTGLSDRDVGFPTLEQRTEDIEAVLDAVGCERAALFGASEGGSMSCMFAAQHPERVSALVLYGCFARRAWAADYPWGRSGEQLESAIASMRANWGRANEGMASGAPSAAGDPAVVEWLSAYFRFSASPRAAERITRLNEEIDIRGILGAIHCPTLVLHREGDRWVHVEQGRHLARKVPGAEFRVLPGEDHIHFFGDQNRLIGEIDEFLTGARSVATTNRSLLTVLMTDIVNSTGELERMGDDRWRAVLEQLDNFVERRLAAYGGERIKHTGDGYLLAFTGPTRAIECARACNHDAARLGLELRTGIHTGECERHARDLSGLAVHLAARIMAEAKPGSILTSSTVKDLVAGSGLVFQSIGTRELRGMDGHQQLFSVAV